MLWPEYLSRALTGVRHERELTEHLGALLELPELLLGLERKRVKVRLQLVYALLGLRKVERLKRCA